MLNAIALPVTVLGSHAVPVSTLPAASASLAEPPQHRSGPLAQAIQRFDLIGVRHRPKIAERTRSRPDGGGHDGLWQKLRSHWTDATSHCETMSARLQRAVRRVPRPRRTDAAAFPTPSTVTSVDDVRIERLRPFSLNAEWSLPRLGDAFGRCANPFASLAQDAQQIYAIAADHSLAPGSQEYLALFAQLLDTVSGVEPRLALVRGLCSANERAIDVIHGAEPQADDIQQMAETLRSLALYKARRTVQHLRVTPSQKGTQSADKAPVSSNVDQFADIFGLGRDLSSIALPQPDDDQNDAGGSRRARNHELLRYASIDGVPLQCGSADQAGNGVPAWQRVPLTRYAVDVVGLREEGRLFEASGHTYIALQGKAYPVELAWRPREFIYSPTDPRLPPLPLMRKGNARAVRPPTIRAVDGIDIAPAEDGFIRLNNKKYIVLNNVTVEVERARLIGEASIRARAVALGEALGAPDAYGIIHGDRLDTWVEGHWGYYRVDIDSTPGTVYLTDNDRSRDPVRLRYDIRQKRWSVEADPITASPCLSKIGRDLAIYQDDLNGSPFLDRRSALKQAIAESTSDLDALYLFGAIDSPSQRMVQPAERAALQSTSTFTSQSRSGRIQTDDMRQAIFRRRATIEGWEQLSVRQKQQLASRITADMYRERRADGGAAGSSASCARMLDLMTAAMRRHLKSDQNVMQILFTAYSADGPTHAALLYADNPDFFEHFGRVNAPVGDMSKVYLMAHERFMQFLFDHRASVAIIDPVGPRLFSDFSQESALFGVERVLEDNLRAADFDIGPNAVYRVSALVPARELPAHRQRSGSYHSLR